jgi:hypothetical protein
LCRSFFLAWREGGVWNLKERESLALNDMTLGWIWLDWVWWGMKEAWPINGLMWQLSPKYCLMISQFKIYLINKFCGWKKKLCIKKYYKLIIQLKIYHLIKRVEQGSENLILSVCVVIHWHAFIIIAFVSPMSSEFICL